MNSLRTRLKRSTRKAQIRATVDSMMTYAMTMAFMLMTRGYSVFAEPEIYALP